MNVTVDVNQSFNNMRLIVTVGLANYPAGYFFGYLQKNNGTLIDEQTQVTIGTKQTMKWNNNETWLRVATQTMKWKNKGTILHDHAQVNIGTKQTIKRNNNET